jgi:hypothetical protein
LGVVYSFIIWEDILRGGKDNMVRSIDILSKADIQNIVREEGDKIREENYKVLNELRERQRILDDEIRVLNSKMKL